MSQDRVSRWSGRARRWRWCQNGAAPANTTNYNSIVMGPNSCDNILPGRYNVRYSGIHVNETHFQVTAVGSSQGPVADSASYCTIARLWPATNPVTPHVDCYDNSGTLVNNNFMAAFTSSRV